MEIKNNKSREKTINRWIKIISLLGVVLFLASCSSSTGPLTSESTGFWDKYILYNLSRFIVWLSNLFGGNYGIGVILFTFIIRALLIPVYKMQVNSQRQMAEIQPGLDAIRDKYPNEDRESLEQMQIEQQEYMDEKGINQYAGCLPLLIQMPVIMALYQTIVRTEAINHGTFLWLNLGERDPYFILPILTAALSYYNSYLTMKGNPSAEAVGKSSMYMMPIMMFLISFQMPSAVGLYFVSSTLFGVIQVLVFDNPYKKEKERQEKEEREKAAERRLRKAVRQAKGKK